MKWLKIVKDISFLGSLALGPFVLTARGQLSAVPEPGLVMYGSVVNTNISGSGSLSAGVINWTVSGNNSTSTIPTTIIKVNSQYFYIARVPFETRHIGSDTLTATPNTLELAATGTIYSRSAVVNGTNAVIAYSSRGDFGTFPFGGSTRGLVERVDLQVNLNIESFQQWALRFFGITNINPNTDADGDGVNNYQEYLAGTDPLNKNSLFILTSISPDIQGGIDVSWQSVAYKTYTLLRSSDLSQSFTALQTGIAATPGTNFFHDTTATGLGPYFYRAQLEATYAPTSPTPFRITAILPDPLGGIDLQWESAANNTYSVYRATNLFQGFINLQAFIPANPGTNTFRDTTATGFGPYYYRIRQD